MDDLVHAQRYGTRADESTLSWLQKCAPETSEQLVKLGLVSPVVGGQCIADLLAEFMRRKERKAESTYKNYVQMERRLLECFGREIDPARLTFADGDDFRDWCLDIAKLGENTTRKRCSQAATFWRWLIRRGHATNNIFDDVPKTVGSAIGEKPFIAAKTIHSLLKVVTDPEWRALIVLGRWGGLRVPSEPFAMQWQDVDWEKSRFVVHSRKTAHQHKPQRTVPLFPEITAELLPLAESQPAGTVDCFPRLMHKSGNVREPLEKMIRRAKLEQWPKLWNSMRSTRETELAAKFPIHVVCEWLGNTPAVAMRSYLKATEDNFTAATESCAVNAPTSVARVKPE